MSFLSIVLMNLTNNLALSDPVLVVSAGLGVWLGLIWGYSAKREILPARLLGPVLGGMLVLGGFSILSTFVQILLVITSFLLTSMFHPIPLTLGILGFSAKLGIDFIQIKIREQVGQAFEHIPPAVAAAAEQLEEAEEDEDNHAEHEIQAEENQADAEDQADAENQADAEDQADAENQDDAEDQADDETVCACCSAEILIGDVSTHEIHFNQNINRLPISPIDSPVSQQLHELQEPPSANFNVVEPLELIRPAGGAGDVEQTQR